MFQRVHIFNGKLQNNGSYLEWQVFNKDGEPVSFDYRGQAFVLGEHLAIEVGVHVYDYKVSQTPTEESVQSQNGWDYARTQKIRREPKNACSRFYQAWAECWRYRKGTADSLYAFQDFSYCG